MDTADSSDITIAPEGWCFRVWVAPLRTEAPSHRDELEHPFRHLGYLDGDVEPVLRKTGTDLRVRVVDVAEQATVAEIDCNPETCLLRNPRGTSTLTSSGYTIKKNYYLASPHDRSVVIDKINVATGEIESRRAWGQASIRNLECVRGLPAGIPHQADLLLLGDPSEISA